MNSSLKIISGSLTGAVVLSALSLALAQSSSTPSSADTRPTPSQACVEALAGMDAAMLEDIDAMTTTHKTALQAHKDALTAAAAITDDAQRQDAVKKANEDIRMAMKTFMESHKDAHQAPMDAVKSACGDMGPRGMKMMHGPMMMGFGGSGHHGFKGRRDWKDDDDGPNDTHDDGEEPDDGAQTRTDSQ